MGAAGTAAVTTVFGYDTKGNQTSIAAPLSRNTAKLYDELNRLKQITDPGTGVTLFGYDANDNLTSVTDPRSKVTSYTYNGFGDVTQQVSPDTGTTGNTYDSGGNLATTTDARSKTGTYSYDALNRVTSIAYPDLTTSFTYDSGTNGAGRLTGASDANHSLSWTYDAQGRVTGKSQTVGAITKSVGYGYTNGNLTSLTTPSGQTITYGYSNGRIDEHHAQRQHDDPESACSTSPSARSRAGRGATARSPRACTTPMASRPTIDSAGAYTYGYDDAFRITSITDLADSTKSWTYGYDALDRLNSAAQDRPDHRLHLRCERQPPHPDRHPDGDVHGFHDKQPHYVNHGHADPHLQLRCRRQYHRRWRPHLHLQGQWTDEFGDERRRDDELRAERAGAAGEEVQFLTHAPVRVRRSRASARRVRRHRRACSGNRVDGRHPGRDAAPEWRAV